jgi:spoIIIJ-associated protein
VVGRRLDERIRVLVDVEDYRKRRTSKIEDKARSAAERVLESGEQQSLEPMDALERKIAHDAVAPVEGVRTESHGEEPDRYVVVLPE